MIKKITLSLILFLLITAGYLFLFSPKGEVLEESNCPFCDPKVLKAQQFYENDLVVALYTHKPIIPGHCLIIPKRHVERYENLTDPEFAAIGEAVKRVHSAVSKVFDTSPYLLLEKNGTEVGQTVPHLHVHYIPRKSGDSASLCFLLKFFFAPLKRPLPENKMQEIVKKLKEALSEPGMSPDPI